MSARAEPTIHEQVAQALGWKVEDTMTFSLPALRDFVRPVSPKLADRIADIIHHGRALFLACGIDHEKR